METYVKMQNNAERQQSVSTPTKKERSGRWTPAQAYLFETLLQKYGKNWKRIHQHMKGRTLSQIRSHGQKYFDKIGAKKVEQLQRRAKLLQAYETLQNQKRLMQTIKEQGIKQPEANIQLIEQESPTQIDSSSLKTQPLPTDKPSEIVKEQFKQTQIIKENIPETEYKDTGFNYNQFEGGFLFNLIKMNPQVFGAYGLQGFIQYPQIKVEPTRYYY